MYYNMDEMPSTAEDLKKVRKQVESHGLRLAAVEGGPKMDKIVNGEQGRDDQVINAPSRSIELWQQSLAFLLSCSLSVHFTYSCNTGSM